MTGILSSRSRSAALAFAVVAVTIVAMGMGVMGGTVAADETGNETPMNATAPTYEQRVDSVLVVESWEYDSGRFSIEFTADEPTRVAMTEAGAFEEGSTTFNYDEQELEEGTSTVTFPVADREGAAVAIATEESLSQGTGAVISIGTPERNPLEHFGGESGLFFGVVMTTGLAGVGAWIVVRSETSGVVKA